MDTDAGGESGFCLALLWISVERTQGEQFNDRARKEHKENEFQLGILCG
jgi:hypothetical protein